MFEFLKRTTAIAAITALPLAPVAAHAESQQVQSDHGAQSQSEVVPSDKDIKIYKSQEETAPEQAEVIRKESGEYVERSSDEEGQATQTDQTAQDAGASDQDESGEQAQGSDAAAGGETEQAQGVQPGQTDQGGTPDVLQGQDTVPGVTPGQPPAQQQAGTEDDALIATVGDAEIRRSDVMGALAQLPPQLQQQPAEMLIPLAIDQLVTRELILQEARAAGLDKDEEVQGMLSADAVEEARENAMVQVWLRRQLEERVTEDKVKEAYETVKAQFGDQAPSLQEVRPQIEGELRQQAFAEISNDLQADAEITVYGPDGQPVTE